MENTIYSLSFRSTGDNLDLWFGVWSGGSLVELTSFCEIWHKLQVDNVRTKLNCRTLIWCHRISRYVGNPLWCPKWNEGHSSVRVEEKWCFSHTPQTLSLTPRNSLPACSMPAKFFNYLVSPIIQSYCIMSRFYRAFC